MITDQTKPSEFKQKKKSDTSKIKGWGVDANPYNDPAYPMKERTDEDHKGYKWDRPPLQQTDIEILRSVERPNNSATFGTSSPPRGLSGIIRRIAYKYSESSFGRWLPLLIADRVDMVEGVISDIGHGHIPNVFAERGWKAEWQYNRKSMVKKIVVGAVVTGLLITLFATRKKIRKAIQ